MSAGGLETSAEFMEEGPDLCGGEFFAGQTVARLRSRMKTFNAASSGGVSVRVSSFILVRMLRYDSAGIHAASRGLIRRVQDGAGWPRRCAV